MNYIKIKNWELHQHYKDRNPPWIKLHNTLLTDYEFSCLKDASKLQLIMLWVLASQLNNKIPNDEKWIGSKLNLRSKIKLKPLIDTGFIELYQDASTTLADSKQDACLETETETYKKAETETARAFGEFQNIKLTNNEYENLLKTHGRDKLDLGIEILGDYIEAKGKRYSSHYAVLKKNSWVWERVAEQSDDSTPYKRKWKDYSEREQDFMRTAKEIIEGYEAALDKKGYFTTIWDKYKDTPKLSDKHVVNYCRDMICKAKGAKIKIDTGVKQ